MRSSKLSATLKDLNLEAMKKRIKKIQGIVQSIKTALIDMPIVEIPMWNFGVCHDDLNNMELRTLSARHNYLPILIKRPGEASDGYELFTGSLPTSRVIGRLPETVNFPDKGAGSIAQGFEKPIVRNPHPSDEKMLNTYSNINIAAKCRAQLTNLKTEFSENEAELLNYLSYKKNYLQRQHVSGQYDEDLFIELKIFHILFPIVVDELVIERCKKMGVDETQITSEMMSSKRGEIVDGIECLDYTHARVELELTIEQALQSNDLWQRERAAGATKTLNNIADLEADYPDLFNRNEIDLTSFLQASKEIIIQPKSWHISTYHEATEKAQALAIDKKIFKGVLCAMLAVTGVLLMGSAITLAAAGFVFGVPFAVMGMGMAVELVGMLLGVSFLSGLAAAPAGIWASLYYFKGEIASSMEDTQQLIKDQQDETRAHLKAKKIPHSQGYTPTATDDEHEFLLSTKNNIQNW